MLTRSMMVIWQGNLHFFFTTVSSFEEGVRSFCSMSVTLLLVSITPILLIAVYLSTSLKILCILAFLTSRLLVVCTPLANPSVSFHPSSKVPDSDPLLVTPSSCPLVLSQPQPQRAYYLNISCNSTTLNILTRVVCLKH